MIFSEPVFLLLFLPVTLVAYLLTPGLRAKNIILLFASLFFYAWGEQFYLALLLASISINYFGAKFIDQATNMPSARRRLLIMVAINLLILFHFKYLDFLVANLNLLLPFTIHIQTPHLPLGISFFTFQAISYLVDLYRKEAKLQKNMINLGLYIASFPQLIAGPIVRYHHIEHQLKHRVVSNTLFISGLRRFILGLSKKLIIADSLAVIADHCFALPSGQLGTGLSWLGILAFSLQIYFDFSAYSDMAIGLGRMFGFRFMENFNYPYISLSIREFWQRWHISLSTWFRDYLYIPLGGNRRPQSIVYRNLLLVFVLCGFWHGANWTFLAWGLIHGLALILERGPLGIFLARLWKPIRHFYVLLIVIISWVFFRAENLDHAINYLTVMFGFTGITNDFYSIKLLIDKEALCLLVSGLVFSTPVYPYISRLIIQYARSSKQSDLYYMLTHTALFVPLFLLCLMYLSSSTFQSFIYFRF